MDLLGTSRFTTLLRPLHLPGPVNLPRQARKYLAYAVDLARNVKDLLDYLALMSPALGVWELGCAPAADGENH